MSKNNTKTNILLIAPDKHSYSFGAVPHLPLALLALAAYLRQYLGESIKVDIIDMKVEDVSSALMKSADIVGFSIMTGQQITYGLRVAEKIRKINPEALLVWGGVHASLLPEQTVQDAMVDAVVAGEGEEPFLKIVQNVLDNKKIEGIPGVFTKVLSKEENVKKSDYLDLEKLPLFAYDLIDISKYHNIEYQFDYQSSRGCPYRCGFCYNLKFCNRRYRKKSAAKVVDELCLLSQRYKIKNIAFCDDEFFIARKRTEEIIDGLIEKNLDLGLIASCRLDVVLTYPDSLLKKMKKAGVQSMFFGAESGSKKILENISKDITVEQIELGAKKVAKAGIRPMLSFMSGFPGETKEDLYLTIDLIRKLWKMDRLITINGIFPFNPYPGTDLYNKAIEKGFTPPKSLKEWGEWSFQYSPDNPWLDDERKEIMQIAFYIVRFKYYLVRINDRLDNKLKYNCLKLLLFPLLLSMNFRLKKKYFRYAFEWKAFASIAEKTFGYL